MQSAFDWDGDVSLPVSGATPSARHASATGAQMAGRRAGTLTLAYVALLRRVGPRSDHEAARALGCQLSTINSTRNRLGDAIEDAGTFETVHWRQDQITRRTRWRLRQPIERSHD